MDGRSETGEGRMETVNATVTTWAHGKASTDGYSHIAAEFAGKHWVEGVG